MIRKGFSLIETLIAIAIITLAIAGPLVSANRALVAAYIARDQLTASYLGQEAVEYVRQMRDSVYLTDYHANPSDPSLSTTAFNDFTTGSQPGSITLCLGAGDGTTGCALLDPVATMGSATTLGTQSIFKCSSPTCAGAGHLSLVNGRYIYDQTGGTALQPFTRKMQFYRVGTEIEVVITVSWNERGVPYSTVVSDYIAPWE